MSNAMFQFINLNDRARTGKPVTAEELRELWELERNDDTVYHFTRDPRDSLIVDRLRSFGIEFERSEHVQRMGKYDNSFQRRPPYAVIWAMRHSRAFECFMDRASLVRETLDHPMHGPYVRRLVVDKPFYLDALPEEERWQRFQSIILEFGHLADGHWPAYTAARWDGTQTMKLLRKLLDGNLRDVVATLVAGEEAPSGWLAFKNLEDFTTFMKRAAELAPYEVSANATWIATKIGDYKMHGANSFMLRDSGWPNWTERYQKDLAPLGQDDMARLRTIAAAAIDLGWKMEDTPLSRASKFLLAKARELPEKLEDPRQAEDFARVLAYLPRESRLAQVLMARLVEGMAMDPGKAPLVLRWYLSAEHSFDRLGLLYVDKPYCGHPFPPQELPGAHTLSVALEGLGFQFLTLARRENPHSRQGYDIQTELRRDGTTYVFKVYNSRPSAGDIYTQAGVIIFPPDGWERGREVYRQGNMVIRKVDGEFHLADKVTYEMRRHR